MDFKQYLSALFYLTESTKYLSAPHQVAVFTQIVRLCQEGYEATGVVGFKIYEQLFTHYPEYIRFDKNGLQKTGLRIYTSHHDLTDPTQKPAAYQDQALEGGGEDREQVLDLFGGKVVLTSDCNDWLDEETREYSGYWRVNIVCMKVKEYSEVELNTLMNYLRPLLPPSRLRIAA
jgi:hypothetical protein